jgi:hypothetical protein
MTDLVHKGLKSIPNLPPRFAQIVHPDGTAFLAPVMDFFEPQTLSRLLSSLLPYSGSCNERYDWFIKTVEPNLLPSKVL